MWGIWSVIGGGLVGSGATYLLTWVRERRRTNDAYRTPQREAIANILEATYELTLRIQTMRDVFEELAKQREGKPYREISDAELDDVATQANRAVLGVGHAFNVGRLTIVDADCYEAMGEAFNNFTGVEKALKGVGEMEPTPDNMRQKLTDMMSFVRGLNEDVFKLVKAGQQHLSPVQTWRNRRKRAEVRKRLEEKYFQPRQDVRTRF
ncbi:hypothetical protein [Mycobacterium sp. E2238]|uniref:hypothetical protein n=1 Tax=Mycobacterium sp. E2238 TaxID=1834131 RepID=UPI0007FE7DD8|nr:hypothetical protein [Mycobacterium sp. E2238]OBI26533.1 hypothetical protein A5711_04940 [Mycobacterium sp. E2238]